LEGLDLTETSGRLWTYEMVLEEASKFTRRIDFQRGNRRAYEAAWRNDWLGRLGLISRQGEQTSSVPEDLRKAA
jgi:hypothetical protein